MTQIIRSNCPRDCYDGCGILVHLEQGARPRVVGDPDHPVSRGTLCGKCARDRAPYARVGRTADRCSRRGNVMRAAGLLPEMTGNVGKPGAGFYYLNVTPFLVGADPQYLEGAQLASGEAKKIGALDLADRLMDPEEFKAFLVWNTNPLASCADQQKLCKACARDDLFTVVVDCFETDTTRFADIILPAASFLEFDDITFSYFNLTVGAQSKVREPIGESLPNQEIFRRIAQAMGIDEPALYEPDEEIIANLMQQVARDYDFAELQRRGHFLSTTMNRLFFMRI